MSDIVLCPNCGGEGLTAITYAYHSIRTDPHGPQLDHSDWSDEYALHCFDCGWSHGDLSRPDCTDSLEAALNPKLQELEEFEKELRKRTSSRDLIEQQLEAGNKVELDEFGLESVVKVDGACRACGSHYRRTHGGWGSVCYECNEPWDEEEQA